MTGRARALCVKLVLPLRNLPQRSHKSQFLHLYNGSIILFQFSTLHSKQPPRNYVSQSFLSGMCQHSAWWFCPLAAALLAVVVRLTGRPWQLGGAGRGGAEQSRGLRSYRSSASELLQGPPALHVPSLGFLTAWWPQCGWTSYPRLVFNIDRANRGGEGGRRAEAAGLFFGSSLRSYTALPSLSVGQHKSQNQPKFKGRGTRLHLSMGEWQRMCSHCNPSHVFTDLMLRPPGELGPPATGASALLLGQGTLEGGRDSVAGEF